jgi:hypothetical protein
MDVAVDMDVAGVIRQIIAAVHCAARQAGPAEEQ